jgi:hypothetical protein
VNPLGSGGPTGYSPSQVRHAYGFDNIVFSGGIVGDGSGTTIAIVDAYDDPNIANDLHQYDVRFGLPDPVFTKVDQWGGTSYPAVDSAWISEIALDVEWAHAIAPAAKILLVEANSNSYTDLMTAVDYAASQPGVVTVSMSWGGPEFTYETSLDSHFVTPAGHNGITFVVSSGDQGAPASYPATSPNVLAVGGTHLALDSKANILSESAWSGSGGGISQYEAQPAFQNGQVPQSGTMRTSPDVAYGADPNTGFPVYDSYNNGSNAPWSQWGGTSAGAPQWAALIAIANQGRASAGLGSLDGASQALPMIYNMPSTDFHDITSGITTGSPNYAAAAGYDLTTGRGSPYADRVVADLQGRGSSVPQSPGVVELEPRAVPSINTVNTAFGNPEVFGIGLDGQVYAEVLGANGTGSTGYFLTTPGKVKDIRVTRDASGNPEVFAIGLDNQVYAERMSPNGVISSGFFLTAAGQVASLNVGRDAFGDPEVFALGLDNQIYAVRMSANGFPSTGYFLTAAGSVKSFVVGNDAFGDPEVFAIGLDNQVYAERLSADGLISTGYFLTASGQVTSIVAGHDAFGDPEVFAIGLDGQVYTERLSANGVASTGFFLTAVGRVKSLAVGNDAFGDPEIFVIGLDNQVYAQRLSANSLSSTGYFLTASGQVKTLAIGHDANGNPEVFVTGLDSQIYAEQLSANGLVSTGFFLTASGQLR